MNPPPIKLTLLLLPANAPRNWQLSVCYIDSVITVRNVILYYNHLPQADTRFTSCNILTMELYHRLCTKTRLHRINFLGDNINSQPFKIHFNCLLSLYTPHRGPSDIKFDQFHHVFTCCTPTCKQMTHYAHISSISQPLPLSLFRTG
jgi:hypothetical protein